MSVYKEVKINLMEKSCKMIRGNVPTSRPPVIFPSGEQHRAPEVSALERQCTSDSEVEFTRFRSDVLEPRCAVSGRRSRRHGSACAEFPRPFWFEPVETVAFWRTGPGVERGVVTGTSEEGG